MEKTLTLNDVAIKAKSKKEVYFVLTTEGAIYLLPIMHANSSYLKEVARGTKLFLYNKNVKVVKVPQSRVIHCWHPQMGKIKDKNRIVLANIQVCKVSKSWMALQCIKYNCIWWVSKIC